MEPTIPPLPVMYKCDPNKGPYGDRCIEDQTGDFTSKQQCEISCMDKTDVKTPINKIIEMAAAVNIKLPINDVTDKDISAFYKNKSKVKSVLFLNKDYDLDMFVIKRILAVNRAGPVGTRPIYNKLNVIVVNDDQSGLKLSNLYKKYEDPVYTEQSMEVISMIKNQQMFNWNINKFVSVNPSTQLYIDLNIHQTGAAGHKIFDKSVYTQPNDVITFVNTLYTDDTAHATFIYSKYDKGQRTNIYINSNVHSSSFIGQSTENEYIKRFIIQQNIGDLTDFYVVPSCPKYGVQMSVTNDDISGSCATWSKMIPVIMFMNKDKPYNDIIQFLYSLQEGVQTLLLAFLCVQYKMFTDKFTLQIHSNFMVSIDRVNLFLDYNNADNKTRHIYSRIFRLIIKRSKNIKIISGVDQRSVKTFFDGVFVDLLKYLDNPQDTVNHIKHCRDVLKIFKDNVANYSGNQYIRRFMIDIEAIKCEDYGCFIL